ncbi:MAG: RagB/SusD family nutrient uptake outer membrane protein [Bacteroidales bacterium]|nr:RagB/SusD family nutrient uptake outer membrane protein [Bacteroidales bacterium]
MKNIFIKSLAIIGAAASLMACSEEYLETAPESAVSPSTIFETTENAELAINGLSKMMTQQYLSTQGMNGEGTIKSWYGNFTGNDGQKCNQTGWSVLWNCEYHERSTSSYDYYPWYYYYKIIGNANLVVYNIDDAEGAQSDKDFIKAQALTFRAYCFLMLSQLYCHRWMDSNNGADPGIVLRIEPTTGDIPLSTLAETYAQIYADLDEAIKLFSGSTRDRKNFYETNIDVAYAVYARAALTREDWANAAKYAALAKANYPIMSAAEYASGFNTPNDEWIWGVYEAEDQTLYYYSYFAYQGANSSAGACRSYPYAISKELIDLIPQTDVRRNLYLVPTDEEMSDSKLNKTSGQSTGLLYKRAFDEYSDKLYSTSLVYIYMQFKFLASFMPGGGCFNNFRSAEMYLTEAEALCHMGGRDADVQKLLVATNKNYDPDYTCTKTGADLLTEVKLYRRFNLWGEGFDWFDYKRWGDTISRKSIADGGSFHSTFAITIKPQDTNAWTWVIPNREKDYNEDIN